MPTLYKQYIAKIDINDDERTVQAVISTSLVDRDKEVLLPSGADLEQYMKNPVVLWAHDYGSPPIGKALWIKAGRKAIKAKVRFASAEISPKAEEIYQLFKGGFLKAFSVGFAPESSHVPTPDEIKKKPEWAEARRIYDKWELLEFSAVPVPANPEALATAVKAKSIELSDEMLDDLDFESFEIKDVEPDPVDVKPIEVKAKRIIIPVKQVLVAVRPVNIKVKPYVDVRQVVSDQIKIAKGIIS